MPQQRPWSSPQHLSTKGSYPGGDSCWQIFLSFLLASLLIYWSSLTTAQLIVVSQPPHVADREHVLFQVFNVPNDVQIFYWYRGKDKIPAKEIARYIAIKPHRNNTGHSYTGRERITSNGFLYIFNVTRNDTGTYTVVVQTGISEYTEASLELYVHHGPDIPIISPSNTHYRSRTTLQIFCQTVSHPPPQYSWFINGEFQTSSQELIIPKITTKDSGPYTCFVYNPATGLNRTTVKNIEVLEPVTAPSIQVSNTKVKEKEYVFLTCFSNNTGTSIRWLFNGQSLGLTDSMKLPWNNSTLRIFPVRREDSGKYQCEVSNPVSIKRSDPIQLDINLGPSDNSPNKVNEVAYTVLNINGQSPKPPTSASPSPRSTETIYSEVKKQ
ncbi:hypothetical protein U0070_024739 [Myodes glareolus]|uniref:Ig-like domain-containing protein n=1 Tax=Myodes glareolus TaxID=447135 RepID=A0AAW0HB02_MYOGA